MSNVHHPVHYNKHPVECITIAEHLNFNQGNALKYVWRCLDKGKTEEDLKKAVFYILREIEKVPPYVELDFDTHGQFIDDLGKCDFPDWQKEALGRIINYAASGLLLFLYDAMSTINHQIKALSIQK